jgi:transcriptional regulator of heat shock response
MVKNVDYESRRRSVLSATINKYIQKACPVSSEDIAKDFDLSPATIRNIFSELETAGYLTHPYTSGGRIPTDKGYRYYVDFLNSQMELLDEEKSRIMHAYNRRAKRLEDALEETSEFISESSRYTGIVSFLEWQDRLLYKGIGRILEQPEFKDSQKIKLLINALEEKRNLLEIINRDFNDKVKVYIGQELGSDMADCSLVVSSYRKKKRPQGKLAVLGPARMEYDYIIPMLAYISDILSEFLESIE